MATIQFPPQHAENEGRITQLEKLKRNLYDHHASVLKTLKSLNSERQRRICSRLVDARHNMEMLVSQYRVGQTPSSSLAEKALFFSAMSIPVSAWI